jgi:two-component system, cell cycle sensor histidine kinase and response regulator CckA
MGGEPRGAEVTILVVDDDEAVARLVSRMLERSGYATRVATSGAEAERVLEGEEVDVIVTDLRMPEMTGPELVTRARDRHPRVKAIYMSGYAEDRTSLPVAEAEAAIVGKPFRAEELLGAIEATLGEV